MLSSLFITAQDPVSKKGPKNKNMQGSTERLYR